ncbi:MAG: 2-hydroxychromene-2-carboxylate isomerase [Pseudomonadota bacterium]
MGPKLEFWHEFASTYSYLSAARIGELAAATGVEIVWRPFLLGPIFAAQGWETSPFNIYPNKGRYMWRDMERRAGALGLPFQRPAEEGLFPQNGLKAARLMLVGVDQGWGAAFAPLVYRAQFGDGRLISDDAVLRKCAFDAGGDADAAFREAGTDRIKQKMRAQTEIAAARGLFGAPSFVVGDEVFWGDDRLEDALTWAARSASA